MEHKYRVNDLFNSLQGEGHHAGRAASFVRFAGCNLACPFCDTDFSAYREMTARDIVNGLLAYPARFVVLTGGEPTLQVDEALVRALHEAGFIVAMESNGTKSPPEGIDWLTVSPKQRPQVRRCDELKCVYDGVGEVSDFGIAATYYYIQPCDTGQPERNRQIVQACVDYVRSHPRWRLSLQTHKLAGFK